MVTEKAVKKKGNTIWVVTSEGTAYKVTAQSDGSYIREEVPSINACQTKSCMPNLYWLIDGEKYNVRILMGQLFLKLGKPIRGTVILKKGDPPFDFSINNLEVIPSKSAPRPCICIEGRKAIRFFDSMTSMSEFYLINPKTMWSLINRQSRLNGKYPFYQFVAYDDLTKRGKENANKAIETGVYYLTDEDIRRGIL